MPRAIFTCMLFSLLIPLTGLSQLPAPLPLPASSYYPPSQAKPSWQRLNVWLGGIFIVVAREGQVDLDSCMYAASRSMGVSMFTLMAEGMNDPELWEHSQWMDQRTPEAGIRLFEKTTGRQHLQLLVLLGAYYAFQPHNYYNYRDSAEYFLNRAISESKSLKEDHLGRQAACLLVKLYALGMDKKGDTIYDALIQQCRRAGDKEIEARALAYWGIYAPPMPATLEKKIAYMQRSADLYQRAGNTEAAINVLVALGYTQVIPRDLPSAYANLLKALELAEAIRYPYTHYITEALVVITSFQGKFGEPLRYVYQTLRTAERTQDSLALGYFYSSLAQMYELEGRPKEFLEVSQKSVQRFVADRNPSVYNVLNNVLGYMEDEGRAKEAFELALDISKKVDAPTTYTDLFFYHYTFSCSYLALGMLDSAELYINKLDSLETKAELIRGPLRRPVIYEQLAYLHMGRKQYLKARDFFEKRFSSPLENDGALAASLVAYRRLIRVDSILNDHEAAVSHYRKYTTLLDSSFKAAKIRQAEELQVLYQMSEKENQITSLTQQAKLEKANSEKAALIRNITIVGIFAALIIAGLLYRQNRLRKKNNQVITEKNEQLQELLADKEWLLKEIHHRVKNNLQIVISLLDSQSEYINNDAALAAIEDNMRRVHAMALIHQKLYQSEDIATIAMPEYINELVHYTHDGFDISGRISFEQSIEPLDLDVSQAIPLGLIINETIVNAIKYAFPNGRKGTVSIRLYRDGADHLVLKISDNGAGLPAGLNTKMHTSLGFDLMRGLTKQLNGSFGMESNNGLHITIRFVVLSNHFSHRALASL